MARGDETTRDRRLLAQASEILAATVEPSTIFERFVALVVPSFADASAIFVPADEGGAAPVSHAGDPVLGLPLVASKSSPILRVLQTGCAELHRSAADDLASLGLGSAMFVPLAGRRHVLAVMVFVASEAREGYDQDDLSIAIDLARLAALAVENARFYESERRGREAAERLQRLTAALAKVVSVERAVATMAYEARAALGANLASVWMLDAAASALELVAEDREPGSIDPANVDRSAERSITHALDRGELVISRPSPARAPLDRTAAGSLVWALQPVVAGERALGVVALGFREPRAFPREERELMAAMARQCASTIERVQLFAAEQRTRAALAETNRTLAALIEASPAGILLLELDGTVRLWNKGAERTFGWEAAEVVGRRALVLGDDGELDDLLARIARSEPILGVEARRARRSGLPIDVALWAVPVARADGEPLCLVVIIDITGRKQAEEAAREASRRKDEFLAMLGHELRNPLAPILTALELMKTEGSSAVEARRVIERQAKHLVRLVDDLLDLSRITRGKVDLALEDVEIAEVLTHAIEMTSPLLEAQAHELEVDAPRSGLVVRADAVRLAQVLQNLLSNSAKYTPPGGRISVRARRDGDAVAIAIEDDGAGIPEELLPSLFEPFVQGSRTLDRAQGGLGIGLSLVQNLVALHGGEVRAQSEGVGKGTVMTVRVPAARPSLAPQLPPDWERDHTPGPVPGRRVLVVDDNRDAAEMLALLLRRRGHLVEVAYDGPSALEAFERLRPDAALLDIGLPVMDGYELATRLRARSGAELLLVAVTGYGQETDRQRSHAVGFSHHLVKPINTKQLLSLLAP